MKIDSPQNYKQIEKLIDRTKGTTNMNEIKQFDILKKEMTSALCSIENLRNDNDIVLKSDKLIRHMVELVWDHIEDRAIERDDIYQEIAIRLIKKFKNVGRHNMNTMVLYGIIEDVKSIFHNPIYEDPYISIYDGIGEDLMVNSIYSPYQYNMPNISDLFMEIQEANIFSKREMDILLMRFGFESYENDTMSLNDIGKTMNLTSERIKQILNKTLRRFRDKPSRYEYICEHYYKQPKPYTPIEYLYVPPYEIHKNTHRCVSEQELASYYDDYVFNYYDKLKTNPRNTGVKSKKSPTISKKKVAINNEEITKSDYMLCRIELDRLFTQACNEYKKETPKSKTPWCLKNFKVKAERKSE